MESAWKARLEEKVVQECSGRGKVGIWVPGERPGRGQGEARISYFGGRRGSGVDFPATGARGRARISYFGGRRGFGVDFPATASRVSSKQRNKETLNSFLTAW